LIDIEVARTLFVTLLRAGEPQIKATCQWKEKRKYAENSWLKILKDLKKFPSTSKTRGPL